MIFSVIGWVVTGAVAGYVASLVLGAERQGCFIHIGLGIAGAFVGAFLINLLLPGLSNIFGTGAVAGFFNGMFHAVFGAVILLVIAELVLPGQQLGMRGKGRQRGSKRRSSRRR